MPKTIEGITFYTVAEVAQTLDVTAQTIRAYIKQGRLEGQRIGRPFLIPEGAVKKLLKA
jgi:excisionase family DNA binding protein